MALAGKDKHVLLKTRIGQIERDTKERKGVRYQITRSTILEIKDGRLETPRTVPTKNPGLE